LAWNPWLKRLGKSTLAWLVRLAGNSVHAVPAGRPAHLDPADILARTDALNEAAERYYAEYPDAEFILAKPYSEADEFPRRLFDLGVLFHALRLSPHDVVLELGAGTCWVSHFLNRYGCKTISVDVSETALALGRTLFERDAQTRWEVEPEFLTYDGHRIPLADGSCDKIVINDAFHHLPNPAEILREMARLLTDGGIVAMSEPGPGHSLAETSVREVETTGVLENEIVLGELDTDARGAGFTGAFLVPISLTAVREVPVGALGSVSETAIFLDQWRSLHLGPHYIILHKGAWRPTTRRPERLDARIEILAPRGPLRTVAGQALALLVRVSNRGDTRWLATAVEKAGWTRLGASLHRLTGEAAGELVSFDWLRASLPRDLDPGEEATFEVELPRVEEPGDYRLVFDLVAERVVWFRQRGSKTLEVGFRIDPP
jgi:SAM-dependent methyltransferase